MDAQLLPDNCAKNIDSDKSYPGKSEKVYFRVNYTSARHLFKKGKKAKSLL